MVDDLSDHGAELRKLQSQVRRLQNANPLESASVTSGRVRFIGGLLLIDSGGKLQVVGHLTGEGDFEWVGPWKFDSPSGGEISGDVNLSGNFSLTGNITVLPGGKIQVGNIIIDPSISGGAITFANGSQVFTDGSTIQVFKGNSVVQVSDTYALMQNGGNVVSVGTDGVRITGVGNKKQSEVAGSFVGATWFDANGYAYKIVPG
ncbi:hypothetical protein [Microbacterium sp.]|uniref:hypothetical protein n=1 Tax=Microbacterium sp. TaxID=51671 RepID=UPI003A8CBAEE